MYQLKYLDPYILWFDSLKDPTTKLRILARLARVENGNFGDYKALGGGLFELRTTFGGGVRIYYTLQGNTVVLLITGGNKASQSKDIDAAHKLLRTLNH
ncbi:addiction module antitoxin RelB [Moraxella caviae]|uniref:Addiction module antitoxin RelB n=1 Tax=Moraxella caviae TaxID=34060 RepID=A0A1S9ZVM7_9GAMM|nr:type II toxin-antitoxin system RelE/ParE family toxin [Moraxella caviae]OOR87479.1 addiction module antitoxin RelB [Moraxella caviae]STZ10620.1 putative addiction module killer protein [Moraxella caviae]